MDGDLGKQSPEIFDDLRHAVIWKALRDLHKERIVIDAAMVALSTRLRKEKRMREVGGEAYLMQLADVQVAPTTWEYYLGLVREPFAKRKMAGILHNRLAELNDSETTPRDFVLGVVAELETAARLAGDKLERKQLTIWTAKQLAEYIPPTHLELVGDNEIFMGYEGVVVFAGPGSSGKSLAVTDLAVAGARGHGFWFGRKVHRQFNTLILQAENGKRRLKKLTTAYKEAHPEIDIDSHVFFSEPPEGGLPFHDAGFRSAVREEILTRKISLVVLDPWSHTGCEDAADAIKEMLTLIRSCFPAGDDCPCLLIVAHTTKPRPEHVRRGRGLMYMVTGSINLVNTSRCTYVMLPWSEEPEDTRVYFATPKLNDGENYSATVWHRKFGTHFVHDDKTNAKDFGKTGDEENYSISEEHLIACFERTPELKPGELVTKLMKISGAAQATAWRAINEDIGHLRHLLMRSGTGKRKLKEPTE